VVETSDEEATADKLEQMNAVEYVEPNYVLHASRVPNDDAFGEQWGLRNLGALGGKADADISAISAWDIATDGNVIVAVIDTGIDYRHQDLEPNVWINSNEAENGQDDDNNGLVDDLHGTDFVNGDTDPADDAGHGSHVAGVIGAEGNNGVGVSGVSWHPKLMGLKFLDQNGEGNTADAAYAIDYAIEHGASVINASWGGPAFSQTLYEAVRRAADHDVLFVAAAGNEGKNSDSSPDYPAAFDLPNVISVAASDRSDHLLPYSNYGRSSVDIAAPGDDIYSTVPTDVDPSGYASFSGTSMAAPSVAGAAALYMSHSASSSAQQARGAILQTADQLPAFSGKAATGGRLNVASALGAKPSLQGSSDRTAPAPFRLLRPRNRYATSRRAVLFKWQRSSDGSGIRSYKLYVDGKRVKTIVDTDGRNGRDPKPKARIKLPAGKHRWFVKAYDYAGNKRRSRGPGRAARKSRSLFIGKRFK
jgi:subtilisin family serine protease